MLRGVVAFDILDKRTELYSPFVKDKEASSASIEDAEALATFDRLMPATND